MIASAILVALSVLAAEQSVDDFFAEFVAKREHIQTLTASFRQDNITPDETRSSGGKIVFVKPTQLRIEYMDPKIIYAVDGLRVFNYEADLEQVQVYDVENSPQLDAFFVGFDNDPKRLREAYDVSLADASAVSCGQRVLKLVPKKPATDDEALSQPYKEIRLSLRNEDLLPCKIEAISDEQTSFVMEISEYAVNADGANPSIRFHVPEGTKVIVNETDITRVGAGGKDLPEATSTVTIPANK
ncbi:MAG: outer membrane lipoprotein carrier protein LolA [Candidatus Hydrogenedentes bacterium]|nr:outer membrane lipoprotein carrier protein LolA [Candidatus Hydrogenedentota bacterium]